MSYAGPASRDKRALELESTAPRPGSQSGASIRASPSRSMAEPIAPAGSDDGVRRGHRRWARWSGPAIALLFAPQTGEDTRRALIADRGRRLADRGQDVWDDLRDELGDARRRRRAHGGTTDTPRVNAKSAGLPATSQRRSFNRRSASSLYFASLKSVTGARAIHSYCSIALRL